MMQMDYGVYAYYDSRKNGDIIISFQDGSFRKYKTGELLLELISEPSIYLMSEKALSMIDLCPNFMDRLSVESISGAYEWLYESVDDEDFPVSTEMFRSGIGEIILDLLKNPEVSSFDTTGEFLHAAYLKYYESVEAFTFILCDLIENFSNQNKKTENEVTAFFMDFAEDLYRAYTRKCSVHQTTDGLWRVEWVNIPDLMYMLAFEFNQMKKKNIVIKCCPNCGRYFIPSKRNDTIYCSEPSPQNPAKTCREIAPRLKRDAKRRTDPTEKEINQIEARYGGKIKRAFSSGNTSLAKKLFEDEQAALEEPMKIRKEEIYGREKETEQSE